MGLLRLYELNLEDLCMQNFFLKSIKLVFASVLSVVILIGTNACNDDSLVVATYANFAPFEYRDGESYRGIDMDIARHIAQKLHKSLVIKDMEFDSVVTSLAGGNAHIALSGLTINETRKKIIDFSDSYFSASQMVIVRSDDLQLEGINDKDSLLRKIRSIPNLKIGVQIGTTGEFFSKGDMDWGFDGFKNAEVKSFSNGALATIALNNHQVDMVIIDEMPARAIVKANTNTKLINIALTDEKYAIGIAPNNPQLRESINAILKEMREDGTLEKIIDGYFTQTKSDSIQ